MAYHPFLALDQLAVTLGCSPKRTTGLVSELLRQRIIDLVQMPAWPKPRFRVTVYGARRLRVLDRLPQSYWQFLGLEGSPLEQRDRTWRHDLAVSDWAVRGFSRLRRAPAVRSTRWEWASPPFVLRRFSLGSRTFVAAFDAIVWVMRPGRCSAWGVEYSTGSRGAASRLAQMNGYLRYCGNSQSHLSGLLVLADSRRGLDQLQQTLHDADRMESAVAAGWHRPAVLLGFQSDHPFNTPYRCAWDNQIQRIDAFATEWVEDWRRHAIRHTDDDHIRTSNQQIVFTTATGTK